MSEDTKNWFKGTLSGWLVSALLGVLSILLALLTYLGSEMRREQKEDRASQIRDRDMLMATIVRDREKANETAAASNQRIGLMEYKLDLLTRSITDIRKANPK